MLATITRSSALSTASSWSLLTRYLVLSTDAYAVKEHGLDKYLDETILANRVYVGLGLLTPSKRKPGVNTPEAAKDDNRIINKLRAVVERVIAQVKI